MSWADLKASLNSMPHKFLDSHRVWGDSFSKNLIWFPLNWEARDKKEAYICLYCRWSEFGTWIPQWRRKSHRQTYFWRMGSPRSSCWQIQCLVTALFLVHTWPSSPYVLIWQKGQGISGVSSIRPLILFMKVPPSWPLGHLA